MSKIENARIKNFYIGYEVHGCFTMTIQLECCQWIVNFGDYVLGDLDTWSQGPNLALWFIGTMLKTVGVSNVKELIGKIVRIKSEEGRIVAIGHCLEDRWFNPSEDMNNLQDNNFIEFDKAKGVIPLPPPQKGMKWASRWYDTKNGAILPEILQVPIDQPTEAWKDGFPKYYSSYKSGYCKQKSEQQ